MDNAVKNADKDVIKILEEKEREEQITKESREILDLMTKNTATVQYKNALEKTIKKIRKGVVGGNEE